ncbi:MAG: riboflavin synthase [Thermodesulfobacteriota bacterium]|nr:riboflavin synthase [Thermodesulfobacteriota bacterium]
MFTGLIEDIGTIKNIEKKGNAIRVLIECSLDLTAVRIGDSIAIDGVCLTIVDLLPKAFQVEVSSETIHKTNFKEMKKRRRVNLERAMRLSDRLGGHIVLGHVDGIGKIHEIHKDANSIRMKILVTKSLMRYIIKKGSVAIDGISLTVNECKDDLFGINIIPHTAAHTTLSEKKVGDSVNIENDIIGKYLERFLLKGGNKTESESKINRDFLDKHGF